MCSLHSKIIVAQTLKLKKTEIGCLCVDISLIIFYENKLFFF